MTSTVLSSATKEVVIGFDKPFVMIGERVNPTGRKLLAAEMKEGNYARARRGRAWLWPGAAAGEGARRGWRADARRQCRHSIG